MEKDDTDENKLFHSLLNIIGEMKENENLDDIKDEYEDLVKVKSTEELIKDTVNAIRYLLKKQNDSELTVTEKVKLDLFQQSLESLYDLILTNPRYVNSEIIFNSENPVRDLIYSEVIKFDYNFYPLIYPKKLKMDHQFINPNILGATTPVLYNPQQPLMGTPPRQPLSNYYYYNRYWSFQQIQRQAYYQHFHPQIRRYPFPIYQPQYNPWDYVSLQNLQYKMAECTEIRHSQPRRILNTMARNSAQKYLEVIQYESYEKYLESRQLPANCRPTRAPGDEGWTFHEFTERYWQKTFPEQTRTDDTTPYCSNENNEWNPTWSSDTGGAQSYELQSHLQNKQDLQNYIVLSDYLPDENKTETAPRKTMDNNSTDRTSDKNTTEPRNQIVDCNSLTSETKSSSTDFPRNPGDPSRNPLERNLIESTRNVMNFARNPINVSSNPINASSYPSVNPINHPNNPMNPFSNPTISSSNPMNPFYNPTISPDNSFSRNLSDISRHVMDPSRSFIDATRNPTSYPRNLTEPSRNRTDLPRNLMDSSRNQTMGLYRNPLVDSSRNFIIDNSRNHMIDNLRNSAVDGCRNTAMDASKTSITDSARNSVDSSRNPDNFRTCYDHSRNPMGVRNPAYDASRNVINPTKNAFIEPSRNAYVDPFRNAYTDPSRNTYTDPFRNSIVDPSKSFTYDRSRNIMNASHTMNPIQNTLKIPMMNPSRNAMDISRNTWSNTSTEPHNFRQFRTDFPENTRNISMEVTGSSLNESSKSQEVNYFKNFPELPSRNRTISGSVTETLSLGVSRNSDNSRNVSLNVSRSISLEASGLIQDAERNPGQAYDNAVDNSGSPTAIELSESTKNMDVSRFSDSGQVENSENASSSKVNIKSPENITETSELKASSDETMKNPSIIKTIFKLSKQTEIETSRNPAEAFINSVEGSRNSGETSRLSVKGFRNPVEAFKNFRSVENNQNEIEVSKIESKAFPVREPYGNYGEGYETQEEDYEYQEENYGNVEDYRCQAEYYENQERYGDPKFYENHEQESEASENPSGLFKTPVRMCTTSLSTHKNQNRNDQLEANENLLQASENSLKASGNLLEASGNLLQASGNSLEATGNLLEVSGNSLKATENLLQVSRNPLEASRNLLKASKYPLESYVDLCEASRKPLEICRNQLPPSKDVCTETSENVSKKPFGSVPRNVNFFWGPKQSGLPENPVDSMPRQARKKIFDNFPGWNKKFDGFSSVPMFSDLFKKHESIVKDNKNFPKLPPGLEPREAPPNEDTIKQILFGTKNKSSDLPRKFCEVLHKDEKILRIDDFPKLPNKQNITVELVKWPMTEPETKQVDDWWECRNVEKAEDIGRVRRKEILEGYVKEICSLQTVQIFSSIIEQYLKHEIDSGPVLYPLHYPLISANLNDYLPTDKPVYICLKPRLMETISQDLPFFKKNADFYLFHIKMSGFYADEAYNHLNYICELDIAKKHPDFFKPHGRIKVSLAIERSIKNMNVIDVDLIEIWHRNEFGNGRWKYWLQSFQHSFKRFKEKFHPDVRRADVGYDKEFKLDITFGSDQKDSFEKIFEEFDKYKSEPVDETGKKIEEIFAKWFDHIQQIQPKYETRSHGYDFSKAEAKSGERCDDLLSKEAKSEFSYLDDRQDDVKMNISPLNVKSDYPYMGDRHDNANKKYSEAVKSAVKPFRLESDDPPQFFNLNKLVPKCSSTMRNVRRSKPSENYPGPVSTQAKMFQRQGRSEEYVIWICGRPIFVPRNSNLAEFVALNFDWGSYWQNYKVHERMSYAKIFDSVLT